MPSPCPCAWEACRCRRRCARASHREGWWWCRCNHEGAAGPQSPDDDDDDDPAPAHSLRPQHHSHDALVLPPCQATLVPTNSHLTCRQPCPVARSQGEPSLAALARPPMVSSVQLSPLQGSLCRARVISPLPRRPAFPACFRPLTSLLCCASIIVRSSRCKVPGRRISIWLAHRLPWGDPRQTLQLLCCRAVPHPHAESSRTGLMETALHFSIRPSFVSRPIFLPHFPFGLKVIAWFASSPRLTAVGRKKWQAKSRLRQPMKPLGSAFPVCGRYPQSCNR